MTKKRAKKRAKGVIPYARRLVEDQYADEQLRKAVARLRDVYQRVSRQQADAALDKKLYRSLREAATSIRNVARRVEEPPPPKRTGRKALAAGVSAGAIAVAVRRRRLRRREVALPIDAETAAATGNGEPGGAGAPVGDLPRERTPAATPG